MRLGVRTIPSFIPLFPLGKPRASGWTTSLRMGATWSTNKKTCGQEFERIAIVSSPNARLLDDLSLLITLRPEQMSKYGSEGKGRFQVDLEFDVAYLQQRYPILSKEVDLRQNLHRLIIPGKDFERVGESMNINTLCNIGALHLTLYDEKEGGEKVGAESVVMDMGRIGYDASGGLAAVVRKIYGIEDISGET